MFRTFILSLGRDTAHGLPCCRFTSLSHFPSRYLGPLAPEKPWDKDWRAVISTQLFIPHYIYFVLLQSPQPALRVCYKFCVMTDSQNSTRINMIEEQGEPSSNWAQVPVSLHHFSLDSSEAPSVTLSLAKSIYGAFKT